jgi:hypothetical protein
MDYVLKAQLSQLIRISATASTINAYGEPSISGSSTFYARVEENSRQYEHGDSEEVRTTHMIILDSDATTPEYQGYLWMPGVSSSTLVSDARRIKIVRACPDENGDLDHWEVLV